MDDGWMIDDDVGDGDDHDNENGDSNPRHLKISAPCGCKTVHPAGCMLLDMACPYFRSAPSTSHATVGYFCGPPN